MANPKLTPRKNASLNNILRGICDKKYYVASLYFNHKRFKLKYMQVSISALDFIDIDKRYQIQKTNIPTNKRGNLSEFAGKRVEIIVAQVTQTGKRMNLYIREI